MTKLITLILITLLLTGCGVVSTMKCGSAPETACKRVTFVGFDL